VFVLMYEIRMRRIRELFANAVVRNPAAPFAATAVIVATGLALELSRRLNHDLGWLLVAANHLVDGASIFRDEVVEVNPPLILGLLAPAVGLARLLGSAGILTVGSGEILTARLWIGLLALASLLGCGRLLGRIFDARDRQLAHVLVAALALVFFVLVGDHFGQREHLMTILLLPYLISLAARGVGIESPRIEALCVGVCAGLGFALKPHYLLVLVVLELALALRRRAPSSLLRPELIALSVTGLVYLASVVVLTPSYFSVVLPLARDSYWAYQRPLLSLLETREFWVLGAALGSLLVARPAPRLRGLAWVLFGACAGCFAAYLIQGTGYRYQRYPMNSMAVLLVALAATSLVRNALREPAAAGRGVRMAGALFTGLVVLALLLLPTSSRQDLRGPKVWLAGGTAGHSAPLVRVIDARAPGGSVYLLSIRLRAAFPTINYSGARWASRFSHPWLLPAVIGAQRGHPLVPDRLTPSRIEELERYQVEAIVEDLERHSPELIIVDRRPAAPPNLRVAPIDLLARFRRDAAFEAIWSRYRLAERVGIFDVFVRAQ
jgi:hypothetical protein